MMCMYAEQEAEEGTVKLPSKDPCPWTSEKKRQGWCSEHYSNNIFKSVPHLGELTHLQDKGKLKTLWIYLVEYILL